MGLSDRIFFSWMNKIVFDARRGKLSKEQLPLPENQESKKNFERFQKEWEKEVSSKREGKEPSLIIPLFKIYGKEYMIGGLFKLLWSFLVILGAFFFVRSLILYVDKEVESVYDSNLAGYLLMCFFFIDACLLGFASQRMHDFCLRVGIKVRSALVSAVAKKAFQMATVKKELSAEIVAFVSSDIQKIYDGLQQLHYLWTAPIEALTILSLLTTLTKQYALPGFGIVFLIVPLQYMFGYLIVKNKYANAVNVASRVALAQEVLPAIKLVKYYCWENFFINEFNLLRSKEKPIQWRLLFIRTTNIMCVFITPPLTAFSIFTAYEFAVGRLTSDLAFTTLSLFNIMRVPLVVLPKAIRTASEALTSLQRLNKFLLLPIELHENKTSNKEYKGISIQNATFSYKDSNDNFKLSIPKFQVQPGEVVGIAGKVGSGKSSVINAVLGHIETETGEVLVGESVAYVRQNPWLQNLSIKDNILFGEKFDENKYKSIIHACALELDFQILLNGDETKAGLQGINLSGGQRQRVSVARAAYFDADTVLLDSPLSAVDYHTSHHIFEHCIKTVFAKKSVVLVTHSLDLLPQCDKIAIMEEGKMVYFGPFSMSVINQFLPSPGNKLLEESSKKLTYAKEEFDRVERRSSSIEHVSLISHDMLKSMSDVTVPGEVRSCAVGFTIGMAKAMRLFFSYGGVFLGILTICFFCMGQSTRQTSDYWIRHWVNDTLKLYPNSEPKSASRTYSLGYMGMMLLFAVFVFCRGSTFFYWSNSAANKFFKMYVSRTFAAPLAFFLNNSVGDLINVFSKDQDIVDENLAESFHFSYIYGIVLLATVATVCIIFKYFILFAFTLFFISCIALYTYLPASTQLKHLSSTSNGALTGLVSEALEGLEVIQAYNKQHYFIEESEKKLDSYHRFFFNSESLNLWLSLYLDFAGSVLVLAVTVFSVAMKNRYKAADVGLAFSNVIQMLVFYTWVIRAIADTISYWGSIERIAGLATTIPLESELSPPIPAKIKEGGFDITVSPEEWKPLKGVIEFSNVWMRYKHNLPWALKNVSFLFQPSEKIGVVGRTGSGKSTLLLALYRMFELGGGRIIYDGIDIAFLTREKLRKSLSIIPQEPLMFSATIRANLDPYNEHDDSEIWQALEKVGLKSHVESIAKGIHGYVDGTTCEWSLGQKQLICLARAALTSVPVLCLDEATAAMDPQTEVLVLKTIDEIFKARTIVTVAHRLDVVIECDRILLLEQGEVRELDTPDNLLSNPDSMFSLLVDRSGPVQAAALRHVAREAAVRKGIRA